MMKQSAEISFGGDPKPQLMMPRDELRRRNICALRQYVTKSTIVNQKYTRNSYRI